MQNIEEFIKKVNEGKQGQLDLSSDEDLSIAIMNLISIEEHFFFTAGKTGKPEYFDLLNTARQMRKELMLKIVKDPEGEVWCISKHLLSASMRLMEVGTKALGQGNKKDAEDMFKKAYELYSLFWGINLKLVNLGDVKKIDDNQIKKQIGYSELIKVHDLNMVDEITLNILDMHYSESIKIKGSVKPSCVVKGVLSKLTYWHIDYVINQYNDRLRALVQNPEQGRKVLLFFSHHHYDMFIF
jgi:hypothetical protein